ncbi:MAG: hypothetical protein KDN18_16700 [Verrucomicrobiae bacterium]|nr:hypothetical protein [Verrucomicrobiae bacterium]
MNDAPPPLSPLSAPNQAAPSPPPGKKSGCGWIGGGCGLGCLLALGVMIALVIFAVVGTKNFLGKLMDEYTATEAIPVEAPVATPEQIAAAMAKYDGFQKGMEPGGTPVPLELTGEELNLLLFNHPSFSALAGKASVAIDGDQLTSRVSLDFADLPIPEGFFGDKLKGKFFNGDLALKMGMAAGRPSLYLENLSVNGNPVPEAFISGMRAQNLLENAHKDPQFMKLFDRIEDIRIKDGQLLVVPKALP